MSCGYSIRKSVQQSWSFMSYARNLYRFVIENLLILRGVVYWCTSKIILPVDDTPCIPEMPCKTGNMRFFSGYLGKVTIAGLDDSSEDIILEVEVHGLKIRIIDGVATKISENPEVSNSDLTNLPTMKITRVNNEFYGLIACLAWTLHHKDPIKAGWWKAQFDMHVSDRDVFFKRALLEYPANFASDRIVSDIKLKVLRHALVQLMGVDSLHNASVYADFLYDTLGEVNINKQTALPIVVNMPGLRNAYFYDSYVTIGNGGPGMLPLCTHDVVAHELAHGVTQGHNDLMYQYESGALNESMSDVLGGFAGERYMYKVYNANQCTTDDIFGEPDYSIGEELMLNQERKMRDMSNPESCNQPSTVGGKYWQDYRIDFDDSGGVHTNSSIPNLLFYKVCKTKPVDDMLRLWYNCLKRMTYTCTFKEFGDILMDLSGDDPVIKSACEEVKLYDASFTLNPEDV